MATQRRTRVVAADDCVEFRMLQIACGVRDVDDWFADFLQPEGIDPSEWARALRNVGRPWDVVLAPTREDLLERLATAQVLIIERQLVDAAVLEAAPELGVVVVYGGSMEFVDHAGCAARGITVTTVRRRTTANVADHVMALLLALTRRLTTGSVVDRGVGTGGVVAASTEQGGHPSTAFNWVGMSDIDALAGRRLAVVGAGQIGAAVLRRAAAFDLELGYVGRRQVPALERELGARRLAGDEVARWADVVSLHVPYAPELRNLVDARFLADLGPRGILLNTSRGWLVDTDALVRALHDGSIWGAGLDVFDVEPLPEGHPLLSAPRTILTAHVGAGSRWHLLTDVQATIDAVAAAVGVAA